MPQGSVLVNIFLNDLFSFVTRVKLNAYPCEQQMFSSGKNHEELYHLCALLLIGLGIMEC